MNVQPDVNQPRTPATDSRALQNLIKSEHSYADELLGVASTEMVAAACLSSWGMAETPDLEMATRSVAGGLDEVAAAQKKHAQAIGQYGEALKTVLEREHSIRSIVRDRDILMGRVIKTSRRKPSRWEMLNGDEEHHARVAETQQELHACEQSLANESAALVGVKRRTFKEALAMRVKTMGDTGAVMMEQARAILLLLDSFDANVPVPPVMPAPPADIVQASAALEQGAWAPPRAPPNGGLGGPAGPGSGAEPRLPRSATGASLRGAAGSPVVPPKANVRPMSAAHAYSENAGSPPPARSARPASRAPRRATSEMSRRNEPVAAAAVPGGVPSAPRLNVDHARNGFVAPSVPGGIPSAPRMMHGRGGDDSDDERTHRFEDASQTTDMSAQRRQQARRARDADSDDEAPGRHARGGSGFFGRMSNLFRSELRATPNPPQRSHRTESLFTAPLTQERRSGRSRQRDDSSDEEPTNVLRVVNERIGHERPSSAMSARPIRSPMRRSESVRPALAASNPFGDDALTEAVRRSVIGAGIAGGGGESGRSSRPPSRPSSSLGTHGKPAAMGPVPRAPRRNSVDLGEQGRVRSASGTPVRTKKATRRSSSEGLASAGSGAKDAAPVRRKRRDSVQSAHPPPAPSSFYVGLSNNPAKFATDTWVAKAGEAPPSMSRSASMDRSSSAGSAAPKSALKNARSATPKRASLVGATPTLDVHHPSLGVDRRFDGTGHLDLSDLVSQTRTSPTKSAQPAPLPTLGNVAGDPVETYQAYLGAPVPQPHGSAARANASEALHGYGSAPPSNGGMGGLAPPLTALPSFYHAPSGASAETPSFPSVPAKTTSALRSPSNLAPASAMSRSPSGATRKSVRIDGNASEIGPTRSAADAAQPQAPAPAAMAPVKGTAPAPRPDPSERQRSAWSTRIGAHDESSDDDTATDGGGEDVAAYSNARKAFGSATRHLGMATGSIQPKAKATR
ncbi:hypothetical protein MSPP1_003288 [Malassezia sp. CBS 17886]|nr:hypothetical protein MSPP1_003288 [Malassezia sp. CBS 17886]